MFAMITTEKYRGLIEAEKEAETYKKAYQENKAELQEIKTEINSLLLMITQDKRVSAWDEKFEGFDMASGEDIAKYINENFVENGILKLKEIKE